VIKVPSFSRLTRRGDFKASTFLEGNKFKIKDNMGVAPDNARVGDECPR